jgi:hypothetical protein
MFNAFEFEKRNLLASEMSQAIKTKNRLLTKQAKLLNEQRDNYRVRVGNFINKMIVNPKVSVYLYLSSQSDK